MTRPNHKENSKFNNISSVTATFKNELRNNTSRQYEPFIEKDSSISCLILSSFHGDKSEDINDWLNKFGMIAQKSKWNEETKLDISRSLLQGLARAWYVNTATDFQKSSWLNFSRAIRCYFQHDRQPNEYPREVFANDNFIDANKFKVRRSLADELHDCKQGSEESVETYGKRVYDLIQMVNINKTMCDVEMAVNLIKGLKADLCREVAMSNPNTFNQA